MSGVMDFIHTAKEFLPLIPLRFEKPKSWDAYESLGSVVEQAAELHGRKRMISFEGRTLSWRGFNVLANQIAHLFKEMGVGKGDCIAMMMENRIEFLATLVGINKLGAVAGLLNTNLTGDALIHCIEATGARKVVVGEELLSPIAQVKGDLGLNEGEDYLFVPDGGRATAPNWSRNLMEEIATRSTSNLEQTRHIQRKDPAFYVFTSGTTGLPKAAIVGHGRFLNNAYLGHRLGLKTKPSDHIYLCLPLYHGTGLFIGFGAAILSGASMFLRRRFSASHFLDEVRAEGTNTFIYIGELCRYLLAQPKRPDDADNPLVKVMGNGLRPDIWDEFKSRFGIQRISEFYGATEGNAGFLNILNKDRTVGTTIMDVRLVQYDVDNDEVVRDPQGHCIAVPEGEPGLLISRIDEAAIFEGYTNKEASEQKIIRGAFETGDAWFNSGDLLRRMDVGFAFGLAHYQFVDRLGDTFRWKGENCSTNEVGELLNQHPQIRLANVYGVEIPGADGRAGMAALLLEDGEALDLQSVSEHVKQGLPHYARPVFLRILEDMQVTGTFKLVKSDLRAQAYHLDQVDGAVYVMKSREDHFTELTQALYDDIVAARAGY
ncbi:MAG: long-chain-acyl-CoA synthetase [Gammaproteobacteria bacterium]|nr:long-chain-acyl-CoA synthetase [Gammaproteobacteria bacterium]